MSLNSSDNCSGVEACPTGTRSDWAWGIGERRVGIERAAGSPD